MKKSEGKKKDIPEKKSHIENQWPSNGQQAWQPSWNINFSIQIPDVLTTYSSDTMEWQNFTNTL